MGSGPREAGYGSLALPGAMGESQRESDISFNKVRPALQSEGSVHPHPPGPSLTDSCPTVWRPCITELTSLKCSFSAGQQLTGKSLSTLVQGFYLCEILAKTEGRSMLAISEAESPGLLVSSALTCSRRPWRRDLSQLHILLGLLHPTLKLPKGMELQGP